MAAQARPPLPVGDRSPAFVTGLVRAFSDLRRRADGEIARIAESGGMGAELVRLYVEWCGRLSGYTDRATPSTTPLRTLVAKMLQLSWSSHVRRCT